LITLGISVESSPSSSIEISLDDRKKGTGAAGSYFKKITAVEAQHQQQQQQQQARSIPMAQAVPVVDRWEDLCKRKNKTFQNA
jgi:hypothetical protein